MSTLHKFVVGIRPAKQVFRFTSLSGAVIDAILDSQGRKDLPEDYFTSIRRTTDGGNVSLLSKTRLSTLTIDTENFVFTKDYYDEKGNFNFENALKEFRQIWSAANQILKYREIRRIGLVGEYRIPVSDKNSSENLLKNLTSIPARSHPAKFHLQFESHALTTGASGLPDPEKSDFWNTIEAYYDSAIDSEHPKAGHVSAMLDVQRYYAPFLGADVPDQVGIIFRTRFNSLLKEMKGRLHGIGGSDDEAKK